MYNFMCLYIQLLFMRTHESQVISYQDRGNSCRNDKEI